MPYYRVLNKDIQNNDMVLDVGCGSNSALRHILLTPKIVDGIEVDNNAYKKALESKYYRKIYHKNILDIISRIPNKSYDVVLLSDIIEHFNTKNAKFLIKECERIAIKKVIIFTPNGFMKQDDIDGNKYQKHLSGWDPEYFIKNNYSVDTLNCKEVSSIYAIKEIQ